MRHPPNRLVEKKTERVSAVIKAIWHSRFKTFFKVALLFILLSEDGQ